jgi:hypothetical protein
MSEQLKAERDDARRERDQLLARLVAVMPWVGKCPIAPEMIAEMLSVKELAEDSIFEVGQDRKRRGRR